MPHIHLLTSDRLDENSRIHAILHDLVETLSRQESIESAAVKAYHTSMGIWSMGEGAPAGFAHCRVELLSGRSPELRKRIAESMEATMASCFGHSLRTGAAGITIELREMDRDTYRKRVPER